MGLFGGGNSSSSNTHIDRSDNSESSTQSGDYYRTGDGTVNINSTETTLDAEVANKALDAVGVANANANSSFVKMLGLADSLFTKAGSSIERASDTTLAQVGALSSAQNNAKGALDQKTMVLLAAAAAAVLIFRGKK